MPSVSATLVAPMARIGPSAIFLAYRWTDSRNSSAARTTSTRPISCASVTESAVLSSISLSALLAPMARPSSCEPPSPGMTPRSNSGMPYL